VRQHVGMKKRGLRSRVIGIGAQGHFLLRMSVVGGYGGGRNERGHNEIPGKGGKDESRGEGREAGKSLHGGIIGGNDGEISSERDAQVKTQG